MSLWAPPRTDPPRHPELGLSCPRYPGPVKAAAQGPWGSHGSLHTVPGSGTRGCDWGAAPLLGRETPEVVCALGGHQPPSMGDIQGNPRFQPKSIISGAPPNPACALQPGPGTWSHHPAQHCRSRGTPAPCRWHQALPGQHRGRRARAVPGGSIPRALPFSSKVSRRFGAKPGPGLRAGAAGRGPQFPAQEAGRGPGGLSTSRGAAREWLFLRGEGMGRGCSFKPNQPPQRKEERGDPGEAVPPPEPRWQRGAGGCGAAPGQTPHQVLCPPGGHGEL